MKKNKRKLNWLKFFNLVMYSMIFSFLAIGLPKKICILNGWNINCVYGEFATYVILMILSIVFFTDMQQFYKNENS